MRPPKKKKQHFVPRFVLRNFSRDGASIATYVLESGDLHQAASIGDQCAKNYFYGREPHMEEAFAESEGRVASILKSFASGDLSSFSGPYMTRRFPESIDEFNTLKAHPLYALREYVYYQHHRTAASAESMEEEVDTEIKKHLRRDPRFLAQVPDADELLDKVKITTNDMIGRILYEAGPFHFVTLDLTVKFLVLDKPGFLLSDHPVVVRNQYSEQRPSGPGALGMTARGLQMFMPVSPTVTVAVFDADVYECGTDDSLVVKVSARNADALNHMQVMNANECMYVHPDVPVDLARMRDAWLKRPNMLSRTIKGPMKDRGDGTLSQMVYTLPPEVEPAPRVRCFRICVRTTEEVRSRVGEMVSFPIRSLQLVEGAEQFAAVMNWKVKRSIETKGLPVDPEWQEWLDGIEDPRQRFA